MISWATTKSDAKLIARIAKRAHGTIKTLSDVDRSRTVMDLTACHCNGCELDLIQLLNADAVDFAHDITGIVGNIDRENGRLREDSRFWPRYAN